MASKSERKFLTTLSFARQIGEAIFKGYENETKGNLINKRSLELMNVSDKYLSKFAPGAKMTDKNLADISRVVGEMMKGGLEDTKSFQTYLAMGLGMLSERETELIECNGSPGKIAAMVELQKVSDNCYRYFASRTRKEDFDVLGCDLLNVFNLGFA
jgi:hypothetical protein